MRPTDCCPNSAVTKACVQHVDPDYVFFGGREGGGVG